jgi:hypothetical protein
MFYRTIFIVAVCSVFSQSKQRIQLRPERPWANGRLRRLIWQAWSRGNTGIDMPIRDEKTE